MSLMLNNTHMVIVVTFHYCLAQSTNCTLSGMRIVMFNYDDCIITVPLEPLFASTSRKAISEFVAIL